MSGSGRRAEGEEGDGDWRGLHCGAVEIEGKGVLVLGASGSGKTSLCLSLVERALASGREACFVCDDQALARERGGALELRAPAELLGKVEIRGFGVASVACKERTLACLVALLREPSSIERMPRRRHRAVAGVRLPCVRVPARRPQWACRIVEAALAEIDG